MRVVTFNFGPTDSWLHVPACLIAEHRADYFACHVDGYEKGSQAYLDEYDYSLGDDGELEDWAGNNYNKEDIDEFVPYSIKGQKYDAKFFETHQQYQTKVEEIKEPTESMKAEVEDFRDKLIDRKCHYD